MMFTYLEGWQVEDAVSSILDIYIAHDVLKLYHIETFFCLF